MADNIIDPVAQNNNTPIIMENLLSLRHQKIISEVIAQLKTLMYDSRSVTIRNAIRDIIKKLKETNDNNIAKEMLLFDRDSLNNDFYCRLLLDYPTLTIGERKICVLTVQHLSTKQISDVTRQSIAAINKARVRLRKKLGLTGSKMTLLQFLDQYQNNLI